MPAKAQCPRCGKSLRSPNHVCAPSAIEREERRKKATQKATGKK